MRPIAVCLYVCLSVCLSVCLCMGVGHTGELWQNGWTDADADWGRGADSCGSWEPCVRWSLDTPREGALLRVTCAGPFWYTYAWAHDCIAHCSPATMGECACPAHMEEFHIPTTRSNKMAVQPFARYFGHLLYVPSDIMTLYWQLTRQGKQMLWCWY